MNSSPRTARILAITCLPAAALSLSACGGDSGSGSGGSSAAATGNGQIAAVIKGLDNPFFQTMQKGITDQASTSAKQVTVQAANAITDTSGQADKIEPR